MSVALAHMAVVPMPRRIRVIDVCFDTDYQRDLDNGRVQKMVKKWDPRRCSPILVSSRGGRLWCIDGQHRVAAMRELGIETWPAVILDDLTQKQEADLFVLTQKDRRDLNAWDLFKAEVTAAHAEVLDILRIVGKTGFKLSRVAGPNHIAAVGAIRRIYDLGGPELLSVTLQTTRDHWRTSLSDKNATARQGMVIHGLAIFLHSFRAEAYYDSVRTARILEGHSPALFLRKSQEMAMAQARANTSPVLIAQAIRDTYNGGGLKKDRRLGGIRQVRRTPKDKTQASA